MLTRKAKRTAAAADAKACAPPSPSALPDRSRDTSGAARGDPASAAAPAGPTPFCRRSSRGSCASIRERRSDPARAAAPPNGTQRRDGPRVPLDVLVQVRTDSIEQFKAEHAVNLSMGGMFLRTADVRTVGSEVYFQFTLKDGGPLIEGLGRVVHLSGPSGGNLGGIGIEFLSVLEPSRSIIRRLVEARIARTDAPAA